MRHSERYVPAHALATLDDSESLLKQTLKQVQGDDNYR